MPLKLYKRGNYWWMRGTVRGEYINETTKVALGHEREAEAVRVARESAIIQRSVYGPAATVNFREAAIVYGETRRPKGTQGNMLLGKARPDGSLGWNLVDAIGDRKLFEVNQELVDKLARERFPTAAPATIQRNLVTPITAVLEMASRRGWCQRPNFERPAAGDARTRWLTPDEAEGMILNAADYFRPMVVFLLGTGARLSEALELEWPDVDLQDARCHFWDTKNGARRVAGLPPSSVAALSSIKHRSGRVFLKSDGKPYSDYNRESGGQIKYQFHQAREAAGVAHVTPHGLRHTWASWFYALSKDVLLLKAEGGWKSSSQVERYAHLVPSRCEAGIVRIWGGRHPAIRTKSATLGGKTQGNQGVA